jgi:ABC-type sugar transport system permease subunit
MSFQKMDVAVELKSSKMKATTTKRMSRTKRKEIVVGLCYALPALLLLLCFRFWPLGFGMWMSLWKCGFVPEKFIGLHNYVRIFTEEIVVQDPHMGFQLGSIGYSLLVTIYYALGTIPVSLILSFFIAYFLFQNVKGKSILRTIFFLPFITSQVAAAIVFKWIFHPNVGIANAALESAGLPRQKWLVDPDPIVGVIF